MTSTAAAPTRVPLSYGFPTVFGRNLVGELGNFVHSPFAVVTMEDLWPMFRDQLANADCAPYLVRSVAQDDLIAALDGLRRFEAFVGLGGGQALDAAKFFSWKLRRPLFTVPTALSVNAAFGQRSGVRIGGDVRYVGWAVPECVFLDYDILQQAPARLNHSGICDVLCFHTGVLDWKYAWDRGACEPKWPYDEHLARQSLAKAEAILRHQDDIRDLNETGLAVLVDGLQWGTSYHGSGWCPRHIEGVDHFVFYALEKLTHKAFLHGQPVCLGIVVGCMMHDSRTDEMLKAIVNIGVDIRPEAMGIGWDTVTEALLGLRGFVREAGLWHSIAHDVDLTPAFVAELRERIEAAYRG
ncbi:MAG: iron-containing alcohol dehydrogenase [Alphaproteobacteria bacterium]